MTKDEYTLLNDYHEITGPTCSGKSSKLLDIPQSRKASKLFFILGFFYCLIFRTKAFSLLLVKGCTSDRNLYFILTVLLNVYAKIGFFVYCKYSCRNVVVDEGVSHIPFILCLNEYETQKFVKSLDGIYNLINIKFIKCDKNIILERLKRRGHKRVRTKTDLNQIWKSHVNIMDFYPDLLNGKVKSFEVL